MDQPGKVANPARGQLNRENNIPLSPCVPENLVSRDGCSCTKSQVLLGAITIVSNIHTFREKLRKLIERSIRRRRSSPCEETIMLLQRCCK